MNHNNTAAEAAQLAKEAAAALKAAYIPDDRPYNSGKRNGFVRGYIAGATAQRPPAPTQGRMFWEAVDVFSDLPEHPGVYPCICNEGAKNVVFLSVLFNGEYFACQTVTHWLRPVSAPTALEDPDPDNLKDSVLEVLRNYGGYWNTCSGCHESEDGNDVGAYPYSETFKTKLGAGCGECGGIGAVWFLETMALDADVPAPTAPGELVEAMTQAMQSAVESQWMFDEHEHEFLGNGVNIDTAVRLCTSISIAHTDAAVQKEREAVRTILFGPGSHQERIEDLKKLFNPTTHATE